MREGEGAGKREQEAVSGDGDARVEEGTGVGKREGGRGDGLVGELFQENNAGFLGQDELYQESVGETREVWGKFRRESWVESERASEGVGQ